MSSLTDVKTGKIKVTDNGEVLLAIESEQLKQAVREFEANIRKIGLEPAMKSDKLHITLKKGQFGPNKPSPEEVEELRRQIAANAGPLSRLENQTIPLQGLTFGALDYSNQQNPPIMQSWPKHNFSTPTPVLAEEQMVEPKKSFNLGGGIK
jgi:hypothetical protein